MLNRFFVSCIAFTISVSAFAEDAKPLHGLLISGGCCHDYPNQKKILTEGISARANVIWTVYNQGKGRATKNVAYEGEDWFKGYDLVLHNECYGGVTDVDFINRIVKAHKDGLPGVFVHCSNHSYRNAKTDEWRKFLGVSSYNHGNHSPIEVSRKNAEHPVMKGFPEKWTTPEGELYNIKKVWENTVTLATGKKVKGEPSEHPCIWVNTYGKGRTFGTTLGHHNSTMSHEVYLDVVSRGLLWACGKLNDDGKPKTGYGPVKRTDFVTDKSPK